MLYYIKLLNWGEKEPYSFTTADGKVDLFDSLEKAKSTANLVVKMKRRIGYPYYAMIMEIDTERNCVTLVKAIRR